METVTTEIVKNPTYGWDVIISENGIAIGRVEVSTKTRANRIAKSKKQVKEHLQIIKCFL